MISWEKVAIDFAFDGAWLDIYVFDVDLSAWQCVLDVLRQANYELEYQRGGMTCELPAVAEEAFPAIGFADRLLSVRFDGVLANCHFFTREEIEFDIDPREVSGQRQLNALLAFMQLLSDATGKKAVLTPENGPKITIFRTRPNRASVEYRACGNAQAAEFLTVVNGCNVNDAICRFKNWSQPWEFRPSVAAVLQRQDSELFERIWCMAMDSPHWAAGVGIGSCAEHLASALQSQFPRLSKEAAQAVVRAASYECR